MSGPFVWAHRGASALAPENTLAAFLLAAELGAGGVELDVRLTADGVAAIVHDRLLWSDGTRWWMRPDRHKARSLVPVEVASLDWDDLAGAPWMAGDGCEARFTRLEEVLEVLPEPLRVDIEIKAGRTQDPRLVDVVASCIAGRRQRVLVSSFDHLVLRQFARRLPGIDLLAIVHARLVDPVHLAASVPTADICVDRPFLTLGDVTAWSSEGLNVSVGGLADADVEEVLGWPVTAVFVDDPRLAGPRPADRRPKHSHANRSYPNRS
ncbi:MAG: glycerophosphodiester phosphodiesterase [Acidimicrobiales bacterium]